MNDLDQHVAEVLQMLGVCANMAPTFDRKPPLEPAKRTLDTMRESIEGLWGWLAAIAAANFPGASADATNPGYVVQNNVLVPFYLLEDLPGKTELAEITALGLLLRLTKDGVICLSGSTALLGTLQFVGDIDYCEYAIPGTYSTTDIVEAAGEHAARTECPLCELVKVAIVPKWERTCATWNSTTAAELRRCIDEKRAHQLKLDFITSTRTVGTVEATNVILLLAHGKEDEIVRKSFAGQEVPIPGSVLPRRLCDPLQLGRYINFLIKDVQGLANQKPVKALKRALSLARILMLAQWCDTLIKRLHDPRAALVSAIEARTELLKKLSGTIEPNPVREQTREALRRSLENTITDLKKHLEASSGTQPTTQADLKQWGADITVDLNSFIKDAKHAIAAA